MRIQSVKIKNYRSTKDVEICFDDLTALVGANGSGKSTVLKALELFYNSDLKIDGEDFFNRDPSSEISISVVFTRLREEANQLFARYIQNEKLVVERVFTSRDGKISDSYHGQSLGNPEFDTFRSAASAKERKEFYNTLQSQAKYESLPSWSNQDAAVQAVRIWEESNLDQCELKRDDGQFFGFKEVGLGYLGRFTRFLFVPASRSAAAEISNSKGSIFSQLMEIVVRSALAGSPAILALEEEFTLRMNEITSPERTPQLTGLASDLTGILKSYIPSAQVKLQWTTAQPFKAVLPTALVKLVEDGYESSVERCGHGLQRAFILSMLQELAILNSRRPNNEEGTEVGTAASTNELPDFLIAIEEPELYQHPSRQRHFANVLKHLSGEGLAGFADSVQVVYCTHSPLFVGIDRSDNIRLLRKVGSEPQVPKATKVVALSLDKVANDLWEASGRPKAQFTGNTLLPRLTAIITPWINEGFFADAIVLVEGEDDRAALEAMALVSGFDFDRKGIAVLPVGGKTNLDRPFLIFSSLGIPVYTVWDGDSGKSEDEKRNAQLFRLLGLDANTQLENIVSEKFTMFKTNLEATMREQIGADKFHQFMTSACAELGYIGTEHGKKNPRVIRQLLEQAHKGGNSCQTITDCVAQIWRLLA